MGHMITSNPLPKLEVSDSAMQQIQLILRHDYTLSGMSFRVKIGGKGCNGFTYQTGFSEPLHDDVVITVSHTTNAAPLEIRMDPFTAFYTQHAALDYRLEADQHEEGFVLTNHHEALYKGKFYKDTTLVPSWERNSHA